MNASKEEAAKAITSLDQLNCIVDVAIQGGPDKKDINGIIANIRRFVEAAQRKLPTEAAFAKDRKRARV